MAGAEVCFSWTTLPDAGADEDRWAHFKKRAQSEFLDLVLKVDREFADQPEERLIRLRQIRREHHLLIIGDRIRRSSGSPDELSGRDLRRAAEFILDRRAHIAMDSSIERRSRLEENMMVSARVDWHKLMRRARSPANLGSPWPGGRVKRGTTTILRKISTASPASERRAEIFRNYVEERLEQLLYVANALAVDLDCNLPRTHRTLIRDLEHALRRARWAKGRTRERSAGATIKRSPVSGRRSNGR